MSIRLFEPNFFNLEYFYNRIYQLFSGADFSHWGEVSSGLVFWFKIASYSLSILFALGVAYLIYSLHLLRREERREFLSLFERSVRAEKEVNEDWQKVLRALESENPADWKVAIMEADNILDKLTISMQYHGENLGERLKNAEISDFLTLEDAWEAHKVRNRIAHETGFVLTKREARRVISLYENVFHEFDYI